jgi:hypothetical protein
MTGLNRETRLQIMLDNEELAAIDDWRFAQRMPSRAAAVRRLLRIGLESEKAPIDPSQQSSQIGVLRDEGQ